MDNGLRFYTGVPRQVFSKQKGLSWEAGRYLLVMYKDYVLHGAKGFLDEDGNKVSHTFEELNENDLFSVPTGIFVMWEQEEINVEYVHAFIYLCYLADLQKSHIVKIKKELVKGATGLNKAKFQEVVQALIYHELELVKATSKNNQVEIPWLEPDHIKNMEEATDELKNHIAGNGDSEGNVAIPSYFLQDHAKLGFTYSEVSLIVMFASVLSRNVPYTFDGAIHYIVEHFKNGANPTDSFTIMAAVRKAERKGIFDIIKDRDGHISISWKGVEV
ncbi:hypothetical protein ACOSZH_24650 [Priestia megaterium]|uniref:hypothetical protein n=1 Tax=Priestia megaterium TaxID=1404 RepID=UPI003BA15F07